ncbi:integrator complex subunit 6-like isoform X1 [Macaca nemestrina]|uniref:Integrator complex subunit 6 like n=5 Tax=Cercopithecinae TaxID=9528 RepID=A0A2K5XT71_MANLE|nr:integrator complex subunit 6-like isoform X1 [Macaca fascicularis]XP_011930330.1 PREDICTED: protein DDX26B isoform X1 [Cercocebus atys]XP_011930331.1 PREDICTED: protein DDX26B isoform X1 [Cercocebus atys]XP_014983709.1 integrator complex subunit 6-like isoform X1 [Macaca mulatta]XP_025227972.1 integrator complex subunit 6-like isoform X1 [Theropithecus gelada]XP_050632635.1 integrator complex subunit 6-like isoform X1 [Macaca thibetana thibetana]
MPILLFLIDTSASMNQRTDLGTSYLDIAKGAVELFLKLRARDPASRGDRYMLVTYDEPPYCIKAGWKENHATFMSELKNLQASGLTTLGQALRSSFDLLNLNRLISGIDNYGQGRNPFFLEPSILITITDGNKLTSTAGVQEELHLPLNSPLPGSELTKEPFRWDQRLFALVLRLPGVASTEPEQLGSVPTDESAITQMCEVTGGRSYCVRTQRMLNQCLESLVQKVQSGVVINFEKTGPDPLPIGEDGLMDSSRPSNSFAAQPWHSCHKLIYVRPNSKTGVPVGHWPIPESFWPDQNLPSLPPRTSHPVVRFSCIDCEPMVIDKLPFDKYELEPSPLTQYILERKSPHTCWQVFVTSSGKYNELGYPFGYLKASTTLTCVNLFVMPYNYPVLLPLLDDLFKVHKLKPNLKWRQAFDSYLKTLPPYYLLPLKKALRMMGAPNLISDNLDCGLSYSVISYLKKLSQQTKLESERILASVGKKPPQEIGIKVKNHSGGGMSLTHNKNFRKLLKEITGETALRLTELNTKEFAGFQIGLLNKDLKPQTYRNAYDIPRRGLLDQLTRMRSNLLKTHKFIVGQDEDSLHSVPVAQMGNYQEYLKTLASPLREIDPDQPKRLHTFGNPFKQDKKGMMIDEADEFVAGPQNKVKRPGEPSSPMSSKRRRSMSLLLRKPQTPPTVTNHVGGKGPPSASWFPSYPNLIKPTLVHTDATVIHDGHEEKMENGQITPDGFLSKSAPSELINMTGDLMPPNQLDSLSDDFTSLSRDELIQKPGINAFVGGAKNCSLSVDDQKDPVASTLGTMPNTLQITPAMAQGINADIKHQLMKEVRKFGRKYERIFILLEEVQGPLEMKKQFVEFTIKEAARFKRRVLIQYLEKVLEKIDSHHLLSNINHINNRSSC